MGRFERFFIEIASQLDLTKTEEETIISSYEAVGKFLSESQYLSQYETHIFPQGSMKIGTTVKPLKRDDYDIDLVCELVKDANHLHPREVKHLVGTALKFSKYKEQLSEHGRCWTLEYNASPPYHLDILPGVAISNNRVKATIRKKDRDYTWLYTNPKGFAEWFLGLYKNKQFFDEQRNVENVVTYERRNPLQRAVQLLKRHRDVYFEGRAEDGPASIIITTLTGLSYNGETSIEEILRNGPIQWVSHIKYKDGNYFLKVPELKDDNYADKWNGEDPNAADLFFEWHAKLIKDLDSLFAQTSYDSFLKVAKGMFKESTVDRTLHEHIQIRDSLQESFKRNLPAKINDVHPLFSHAKSIRDFFTYIYKEAVKITIAGNVFRNEADAYSSKNSIATLDDESKLLSKNLWLRFTANIKNCSNYRVLWQVTNTGNEAKNSEEEDPLRGNFYKCQDGFKRTRIEHTAYSGTHFVQAFLIESTAGKEYCVAKSNILTINIGAADD